MIYQHVSKSLEMEQVEQEQVKRVWFETSVPFLLSKKQKSISIYISIKIGNTDIININIRPKILSFLSNQARFIIPSN